MNIIFDFDGTLVDSSERMYRLFQKLVPESTFTKDEYWKLKRNKISHKMILERYFPQYGFEAFNKTWLEKIELQEYLDMDKNYPDTVETLQRLSQNSNLVLLTARQYKSRLVYELEKLKLRYFFNFLFVTEARSSKKELLLRNEDMFTCGSDKGIFVSDMGEDITIGNQLGYHTIAVTHGFMNKGHLQKYDPNEIVDQLGEIKSV